LSREDVVRAAIDVTRRQGLGGLRVRAVADELGVTSPALYHHVPGGKHELVELIVDSVVAAVENDGLADRPGESWLEHLERIGVMLGQFELEYPGVMPYMLSTGAERPVNFGAERILRILEEGGFSTEGAAQAFAAIGAYVAGWAVVRRPSPDAARVTGHGYVADVLDLLASIGRADELRTGLHALLVGLRTTVHDMSSGPAI
jgi:TetR/AcrR family tetracycline transcriptional repressor